MLYGRFEVVVDAKWRLTIPSEWRSEIPAYLIVGINKEGCVGVYSDGTPRYGWYRIPVHEDGDDSSRRITIPCQLRSAVSFWYGRTVTLVSHGRSFELWPRPVAEAERRAA